MYGILTYILYSTFRVASCYIPCFLHTHCIFHIFAYTYIPIFHVAYFYIPHFCIYLYSHIPCIFLYSIFLTYFYFPYFGLPQSRLSRPQFQGSKKSSKVSSVVILYREDSRALTFQNFCQKSRRALRRHSNSDENLGLYIAPCV